LSGTPPTVTGLELASTQWSSAFHSFLQSQSLGEHGYRIPTGTAQSKPLPWSNLDQLIIAFSQDVNVKASDLSLTGVSVPGIAVAHFFYDAVNHVATWTLAAPLPKNIFHIDLNGDGLEPVTNVGGDILDGEWINNADAFPSGNQTAGGDFGFTFRVLPGDVDQNAGVTDKDWKKAWVIDGSTTTSAGYNPLCDIDGSGQVNSYDMAFIDQQIGQFLAAGTPVGVSNDAPSTLGGRAVDVDDSVMDLALSLFDEFQDAETADNQLIYQIVSVSNPWLFDSTSINASGGTLVLNAAASASGRSEILVTATDAAGQSTTATFVVDVAYTNEAPGLDYWIEPVGADTFRVMGYVLDDDDVEGLFVEFSGSFNTRATVGADGWFDFSVILYEPEWGTEWGKVRDFQNRYSPSVERYAGVS
jgi:hypothetical protein